MIFEFHDKKGQKLHDEFKEWRIAHFDDGFFLAFKDKRHASLHSSHCRSKSGGDGNWDGFFGTGTEPPSSLTKKRKVCSNYQVELLSWADMEGIVVIPCVHCLDQPPTTIRTKTILYAASQSATNELDSIASAKEVAQAVEGIAREITVTTRSRSDLLRRAALEKAKGVCEACGTDYSRLLGGLGKRVLQVHHRQQLSFAEEPKVNGIEDVAVVCANCHLIIHTDILNAMPVEELRRRLRIGEESKIVQLKR